MPHITIFLISLTSWHQTHHILGKLFRDRHESRRRNRCAVFPQFWIWLIVLTFFLVFFILQMYYLKWNWNDTFVELANMPNWNRCRGRKNKKHNRTNRTKGQSTIKNIGCSDFTGRCRSKDPFPLQKDYSRTWHVQISRYQGSIAAYTSYIICM